MLSNCSYSNVLKRYLEKHSTVLSLLANWFKSHRLNNCILFADIPGSCYKQTQELFVGVRPDTAIMKDQEILAVELTICHETNFESSKHYKRDKYKNLNHFKADNY